MIQNPNNQSETSPESAELFHLIVENVKDYAIFMTDVQGIVVSWNPGVESLLGYTESEITGQPINIIFTPEDRAAGVPEKEMTTAAREGRSEDKRWHQRKDGSRFWANGMVMPLRTPDGSGLRGFAKIMRDDTAHKLAEDSLKEVLSSITDSFIRFDNELRYTYVNQAMTEMFGLSEEEFLGKRLEDIFPDVEGNKFHSEVRRALKTQETVIFENYYEPLDRWFENRVYPTGDGLSIFVSEITERKRIENSLRESEEKYRTLFDSIDEGFCVIEMIFDDAGKAVDYRFVEINPAFEQLTGIPAKKALSGIPASILVPNLEQKWYEIYGRVALTGEAQRFSEGSDAMNSWFDVYAFRVDNPEMRRVAVLFNNITERKLADRHLRESERRLSSALTVAQLGLYEWSLVTDEVFLDARSREILSFPGAATVTAKDIFSIIHPQDYQNIYSQTMAAVENLSRLEITYRVVFPDKTVHIVHSIGEAIIGENGRAERMQGVFIDLTEQKQAEEALRQSEEKYRTLFNTMDEGFCVVEILFDAGGSKAYDHRFLDLNPSFERLTGISAAAAREGKTIREMVPGIENKFTAYYERVALTGDPVHLIEESKALNRWFEIRASRVGGAEERKVAILFSDITERKKSEIAVREAEQRYRALIDSTATTVWHADPEGVLTFVGERWTEVSGQTIEEILNWDWLDTLHPDDREPTIEKWQTALANKTLFSVEFRVMTTTGEYRWFDVNAVPIFEADGSVREWIGSNIDITARKRAEEEREQILEQLEFERSRLAYIFENTPAFVTVLRGPDHAYELTNPAYLRLIGHREVIGKTVRHALPELAGQGYFEMLDDVFRSGKPFVGGEMPVDLQYTQNGPMEKRFINFVFQPMFGADGKTTGIFVHGVDITEQVESRRHIDEARQAAENANRLKDEFLATLSHELRTPLNAILGWSQMLRTQNLGEEERVRALMTIERNARSQSQLIEDILDVSRIITGKLRLNIQAVNLSNVISAAVDAARPAAEAKNIRLQILLDPQAGPISGDPDRLQQVVWNLLSNAVKFTPKDGRVQVRLERVDSHVEIVVSDTGKGIEAEFLPHVFDRFRQSDGSMTRRHGGLGLGLAIVRQIVELHGGTVSVESAGADGSATGATFSVQLPLLPVRRKSDAPRVHPTTETGSEMECSADLAGLSILMVDDEADSRDLLQVILTSCGAQVVEADSAAEAFEKLKTGKFDLLISDIGMPEEDGFSLIRKIRELPGAGGGNVPAIALTAYARAEDRIQAIRSGFQMHMAKPVEPAELVAVAANLTRVKKNPDQDTHA